MGIGRVKGNPDQRSRLLNDVPEPPNVIDPKLSMPSALHCDRLFFVVGRSAG